MTAPAAQSEKTLEQKAAYHAANEIATSISLGFGITDEAYLLTARDRIYDAILGHRLKAAAGQFEPRKL